jgi:hypothetical protein
MAQSTVRRQSPVSLKSSRESSPSPLVGSWSGDVVTMSIASRPTSMAVSSSASTPTTPSGIMPPSLSDILANTSQPPWTLSAFMAYLSQNHCLETLEFTMEAERYKTDYTNLVTTCPMHFRSRDQNDYVCGQWAKLMQAYIVPCAPREVNLPSCVRDRLLSLSWSPMPPHPTELNEAVAIVYELMNDSVLVPFIESVSPSHWVGEAKDQAVEDRRDRSRSRVRSPKGRRSSKPQESSRSPKFLPAVLGGRASASSSRSASASTEAIDRVGLTDDSGANSPPPLDPTTPPTTPPTSEWTFSAGSPGGLQRALNAHNQGWKRMGAKLGFKKPSKSHKHHPSLSTASSTSSVDGDVVMCDSSMGGPL